MIFDPKNINLFENMRKITLLPKILLHPYFPHILIIQFENSAIFSENLMPNKIYNIKIIIEIYLDKLGITQKYKEIIEKYQNLVQVKYAIIKKNIDPNITVNEKAWEFEEQIKVNKSQKIYPSFTMLQINFVSVFFNAIINIGI